MATKYPNGYGNRLVTFAELRERHEPKMHPEYARRLFACIEAAEGLVGIGNGWRSTKTQAENYARDPNTFAPPGLSFHQTQTFASGIAAYAAVDTVGPAGRHPEAWNWMRDRAGQFGLHTFWNVNGEPWHTQCNDVPNGVTSWKKAGTPDPATFTLSGAAAKRATADYGLHPLNDDKPVLLLDRLGDLVSYVQRVILNEAGGNIAVDGDFGPQTDARVRDLQSFFTLSVTGIVDWNGTWQVIDHLAGHKRKPASKKVVAVSNVKQGIYWVQRGDSPWAVAERVYGKGSRSTLIDPPDPADPGFMAPDHHIGLPEVTGLTTKVLADDRPWAIITRLRPGANPAEVLDRFYALNGGQHRVLHPGDLVFLDAP